MLTKMKEATVSKKFCALTLIATLLVALLIIPSHAADMKFIGEVNDTHQLVTEDQIYDIADNELGDKLVYEHIGDKVEVTGTLSEIDDMQVITVKYFKVVSE